MQASEIKKNNIAMYCKFMKKNNVDIIYLADSLGCLSKIEINKIFRKFKESWDRDLGIHSHDNLGLALKNSISAINSGANWVDCTIEGMGRGPGNTKTDELIRYTSKSKKNYIKISKRLKNFFLKLKKKYRWGTNKFYYQAGLKKIHPTYIQEILSNRSYTSRERQHLINKLSKMNVKKYNPLSLNFLEKLKNKKIISKKYLAKKFSTSKMLILGPGKEILNNNEIKRIINSDDISVFFTNKVKNYFNIKNFYRVACHPYRLIADYQFHKENNDKLILPILNLSKDLYKDYDKLKKKIFNFGLKISNNNKIRIEENLCYLPEPLVIGYALAIALASKMKLVYIAGFEGYDLDNPYNDQTQNIIDKFIKKKRFKLISLTKTKYKLG